MLVDSYGRQHDYLRISVTDHCNFRCNYCMPQGCGQYTLHEDLMSMDEIAYISKLFVAMGVKRIRLTGGEPLVRKDFDKILKSLSKLPVKLAITTNGVLLDRFLHLFKLSGLRSINISLDSLKPDKFHTITHRNDFTRVRDNILLSIKMGFKVKLNVVIMKGVNEDEVTDFVALTNRLPIHVRFIEFMPFLGNMWDSKKVVPSNEILKTVGDKYDIIKLTDHPNSTSKLYRANGYKGTFGVITAVTDSFCGSCNRLRLAADGKLRNCLFSKDETDLLSSLRKGKCIHKLIKSSVMKKDFQRGGLPDFTTFKERQLKNLEHSMVKIGG
jgi:cyclic pyranopterin phosphate synthase